MQHSCSHSNAICNQRFKNRIELHTQTQPLVAKHIGGTIRAPIQTATAAHTRYLSSPAAATLHEKTQGFVLRLPPHNIAHATFMQPFQCDLPPQRQETHRTTHAGTTTRCKTHCSGFLPNSPLPFLTASHRHHFPSSPPPFVHFPSSPLPFLTTSHRPHLPSSPFPFIITSLRHHFPSSPLPFVTTSLRHHFPSSPLPIVTTSLHHHFPSSPLPFVTTRHYHHPSSKSIPLLLILLLCIVMLCIVMWSTTLHHFKSQNSICP